MRSRFAGALLAAIAAASLGDCGSATESRAPERSTWSAPGDWVVVTSASGDLQLTLPPWLVAFEATGPIFANEAPPPGGQVPVQLLAEGPNADAARTSGADLVMWIELHVSGRAQGVANPGEGLPSVTQVQLPAGPAVRYVRVDRVGTPLEWRFLVFAIQAPTGLAYLQIDGTPAGWAARSADFDHIAQLLRTR